MNIPNSREQLEAIGFTFERRTNCGGERCGALIEYWRKVPGPQIPFRLLSRTGMLIQHTDECPGKKEFRSKPAEEKPVKVAKPEKPKRETVPQGRLF